jgi:proline dehydrogenase
VRRRLLFALATNATFERAVRTVPGGEARAWRAARRYVAGREAGDAVAVAERLAAAGPEIGVRLVKGAYVEADAVALPWGAPADAAYAALARRLGAAGVRLALATHDRALRAALLPDLPDAACELLLGVHPADAAALARAGRTVRIYVPYGEGWFRYLMRRRAEAQGA